MKRTNVVLDEELLERARRHLGEKTYSGTITKALENVVRQERFWELYREWEHIAHTEGVFHPDYVKEKMRKSLDNPKNRIAAHEARAPRKKKRANRSR